MICYHGTTRRAAERICREGFLPRRPSRRVWFARSKAYADGRARTKARRAHDRPVVLTCDINVNALRERLGSKRVIHRGGVFAVDGPLPVSVLRSHVGLDVPSSPQDLARWVNRLLRVKPYKGVSAHHPGIERLSRWVTRRRTHQPKSRIAPGELLLLARQWLPEYFEGVEVDPDRLSVRRAIERIDVAVAAPPAGGDPREREAIDCLESPSARRRVRGLHLLATLGVPDLFDWCTMFMDDQAVSVRVAVLRMMLKCDDAHPEEVLPLAESGDKRVRAAAIAVLAKHGGRDGPRWYRRGLKDPSACVRQETAALLQHLDPAEHHDIFELARYDPNPAIARRAEKHIAGKGYAEATP